MSNVISKAFDKYQGTITSPLMQSALLAGIMFPAAYYLKNPIYRGITAYSMMRAKTPRQKQQILQDMQDYSQSWQGKWGVPVAAASVLPLLSLALNFRPNWKGYGLTQWGPGDTKLAQTGLDKKQSLWQAQPYQPTYSLNTQINPSYITGLIQQNPVLNESAYAQNLGTAILNAVPTTGFNTTLGNVYDSAVNKFDKKLSFTGLSGSALKGVIAGSMAGMFTDVVGAMAGLPKSVMDPISGDMAILNGVGTALKSILL